MGKSLLTEGVFITFEGGEGAGKSSQIKLLEEKLNKLDYATVLTREPGGTAGAEAIRHVILSGGAEKLGADVEAMLFSAARSDHVQNVIKPALKAKKIVLCDRFFDSTRVYQGATGSVEMEFLYSLERVACDDIWPDLTIILDLSAEEGMRRANARRSKDTAPDRFEKENMQAQELRREAFRQIANEDPDRCKLIDASGPEKQVAKRVWSVVKPLLERKTTKNG